MKPKKHKKAIVKVEQSSTTEVVVEKVKKPKKYKQRTEHLQEEHSDEIKVERVRAKKEKRVEKVVQVRCSTTSTSEVRVKKVKK